MSEYQSIKPEVLKIIDENFPKLSQEYGLESLTLFGSVARGDDRVDSDIDIAYRFFEWKTPGIFKLMELAETLEELLGKPVDFVPLQYMKPDIYQASLSDMISFRTMKEVYV